MPPKPRRKSEKSAETVEREDSDAVEDDNHVQHEAEQSGPQESQTIVIPQPPPDIENEEFIPDPNILSAATQSVNTGTYYQHSHSPADFRQLSGSAEEPATSGTAPIPDFTYHQAQSSENVAQPAPTVAFPSTSVQPQQSHGLSTAQSVSASAPHQAQPASSNRKSLPTSQSKQTPVPPPAIPAHGSNWGSSPVIHHSTSASPKSAHQQPVKRPKSRKARAEPEQHGLENAKQAATQPKYQSPMTRSPYQSTAQVNTRQAHNSQATTPVATNSRPPPQAPSTTAHPTTSASSYNAPTTSSSISNYDAYPQYNNTRSGQYSDAGNDHSASRISYDSSSYQTNTTTTASSSYSSMASYDYGRTSGAMNPLSQALNNNSAYSGTTSSTANQWPTSQTRGAQNNNSSGYSLPASGTPSHGYSTRGSESRTSNPSTSYHQGQAQSYTSYQSSQQPTSNQQNQQNWYGFTAANSNNNQASYTTNRQTSHNSHRSTATGYSSQYGGNEDQSIYDLLRAGSPNH